MPVRRRSESDGGAARALSVWLTTLAGDRPLTFLDHHLVTGNSLLGARLADLARPVRTSRRTRPAAFLPLFADQVAEIVAERIAGPTAYRDDAVGFGGRRAREGTPARGVNGAGRSNCQVDCSRGCLVCGDVIAAAATSAWPHQ